MWRARAFSSYSRALSQGRPRARASFSKARGSYTASNVIVTPNSRISQDFFTIRELSDLDDRSQDEPNVRDVYLQPVWQTAIREELKSLEDAGTFERVHISDLCTDTKALNRSSDALHYRSDGA